MISAIFIAPTKNAPQQSVEQAQLVKGKGIVGDRAFGKIKNPGQNITFVELEEIENFNAHYQQTIANSDTRRNVVTKGVRLNDLVGKTFFIGEVKFFGVELCEPCSKLGGLLENESLSNKEVVKALVHKAGLRADILTDGNINVGMTLSVD